MDRSWMNAIRISDVYENGIEEFLKFAERHGIALNGKYFCPCVNCVNGRRQEVKLIREHLLCDGILKSYTTWTWHGEVVHLPSSSQSQEFNPHCEECMEDMIEDIGQESFRTAHVYDSLKDDSEKTLYHGCRSFTRLSATQRLFNIKAKNGWTDKSFSELLELLNLMLSEGNTLQPVIMRLKRYYVRWVWSTRKVMLVPMTVFFIEKSSKH